jgi:cytochrome o ubiquinol oxidase subunit 2
MKKFKIACTVLVILASLALLFWYLQHNNVEVLNPKGLIAEKQKSLVIIASLLMVIVVIPVFVMTFYFVWKYRAGNPKAKYSPDWAVNHLAEAIWWGLPCLIVVALSIIAWKSSHELDPFRPLDVEGKPMRVQVVALQWKWLFIYPEQKIATVNFLRIPQDTPINFEITSDAPMNSLWIPQLGGQVYAMPGMKTKLHLIANEAGNFRGSSANLSGSGFAGMRFYVTAGPQADFDEWVATAQHSQSFLNSDEYGHLAEPTADHPKATYVLQEDDLFDRIVMKYMEM